MGKFPFLDKIYADPEVTSIELNEIEQTLTLYCSSQEKLDRLLFEVRGHMSLHKAFTWRKKYHAYFSYHIRINENEKKMDATFKKVSGYHKHVADFTDVVEDPGSLQYISLSRPQGDHDGVFQATTISHTHCLYSLSSMTTAVLRLLQFADFPILQNVAAYTKIGFTLYKLTRTKKYGQVQKPRTVVDFFNHWETNYYGQFSFDLNYSFMNDFVKLFRTEEFIETCRHDFIEVFFNDLGTNFRYMARIDGTQPPLNQHVVEYRQCKMHHCHFRLIELGGFKSCKEIILSSQRSCCNSQAKDFVEESIKSGELLEENVMSMNSYYSMYNVSIVNRIIFKYRNFIIHLDCVKKKSNQRYGKFSNVVHLTLHYPELNESLKTLQSDINDILLRNSIIDMYKELVSTKGSSDTAIEQVENKILSRLTMEKFHLPPRYSDNKPMSFLIKDYVHEIVKLDFKDSFPFYFDICRFRHMFDLKTKALDGNGKLFSVQHIHKRKLAKMQKFEELWNKNSSFVDKEEIWRRAIIFLPPSKYIDRILVTSDFLRPRCTQKELKKCKLLPGINYISISEGFKEEDLIMSLEVGSSSRYNLDSCKAKLKSLFSAFLGTLTIHRLGSFENVDSKLVFCIPYTVYTLGSSFFSYRVSEKNYERSIEATPKLGYLQDLYDFDPEVNYVELNEIEHTISLGCTSNQRLDRLKFEVHGNSLHFMKLVPQSDSGSNFLQYDPYSNGSYTLYDETSMLERVREFPNIDDYPKLKNVGAFIRFGVTLFRVEKAKDEIRPVSAMIDCWEEYFNGVFSFDLLPSYKDDLEDYLSAKGFSVIDKYGFTQCFFNDIVKNLRFMVKISDQNISSESTFEYNYCKTDHIHFLVIDIDSSKCSSEIIMSSQMPCDLAQAKTFVQESIKSGELFREHVMSLNSYFSMYNVSMVNRTVFKYKNLIIHLDGVSKKSNQRYGKFSDVVNLTLHSPQLNASMQELQANITNNESLKRSIEELSKQLITAGEYISGIIDKFIEL
ncbi:hypothetical protein ACHWQZ_G012189 [Mnemiopsis leidyi]